MPEKCFAVCLMHLRPEIVLKWQGIIVSERASKAIELVFIKDAMPVSFRSKLFTSYIVTIFKQRNLLP